MKKITASIVAILAISAVAIAISAAKPQKQIDTKILLRTQNCWTGAKIPAQNIKNPEATLVRIIIPAKTTLPMHEHDMINVAHVVRGTLLVKTESGDNITLKAGDSIVEVVDTWHYGTNIGDDDVELIVFYLGEKDTPLSVKK